MGIIQSEKIYNEETALGFWKDGISMRTEKFRLVKFFRDEEPKIELNDHFVDSDKNFNKALDNLKIIDLLLSIMKKHEIDFLYKALELTIIFFEFQVF